MSRARQQSTETPPTAPAMIHRVTIRTDPETLWRALTDGEITRHYYFGTSVRSGWRPGDPYQYVDEDGGVMISGTVVASDPPWRLVTTFRPHWGGQDFPESTVTFEIERDGNDCTLTVIHADPPPGIADELDGGWPEILAGLRALLERDAGRPDGVEPIPSA